MVTLSTLKAPLGRSGRVDFAAVNAAALPRLADLCGRWLPDGRRTGREWKAPDPRNPGSGHVSVNLATGRWCAYGGAAGGDVVSLAAYLHGLGQADAARRLADMLGTR